MDTNLRRQFSPTGYRRDPRTMWPGGTPADWDGGFGNRWLNAETADKKSVLRQLGLEPVMTAATERFFARSARLGLEARFAETPASVDDVIRHFEERLRP